MYFCIRLFILKIGFHRCSVFEKGFRVSIISGGMQGLVVLAALFCWIGGLSPCFITNCPLKVKERLNESALNSSM
jgi:hypothetical protein